MLGTGLSKMGLASHQMQTWYDLGMLTWMPTIGTVEVVLALLIIPRWTRMPALVLAAVYHAFWVYLAIGIDNWVQVTRSVAFVLMAVLAIAYGRTGVARRVRSAARQLEL